MSCGATRDYLAERRAILDLIAQRADFQIEINYRDDLKAEGRMAAEVRFSGDGVDDIDYLLNKVDTHPNAEFRLAEPTSYLLVREDFEYLRERYVHYWGETDKPNVYSALREY